MAPLKVLQFLAFLLVVTLSEGVLRPEDWATPEVFNNRMIYYVGQPMNFFGAYYHCLIHGKGLLRIYNDHETELLKNRLVDINYDVAIWLSGVNLGAKDQWIWLHTLEKVTNIRWEKDQPNDPPKQHCLGISSGGWFDLECNWLKTFYCEDF